MRALLVLVRPRAALEGAADAPRLEQGLAAVLVAGLASAGIDVLATVLGGAGFTGLLYSVLAPVFFVLYWLFDAWLVDAGARWSGAGHRRRAYLAVSGLPFLALVAYAVLLLAEALATRWSGSELASNLAWLSLPLLAWFVGLMAASVAAVYRLPAMNAFALALLPFAAILTVLLVALLVLSLLHGLGVV